MWRRTAHTGATMYQVKTSHTSSHARVSGLSIKASLKFLGIALAALTVAGCGSMKNPDRLYPREDEISVLKIDVKEETDNLKGLKDAPARHKRNEIVAARKYAIDLEYTKYESDLIREAQLTDFSAKAATLALRTTADLTPVAHTSRMLGSMSTGVGSLDDAYNADILRAQLLENIQSSMRTARHERAAVIFNHMRCSIKTYPLSMALSDLEAYYRAGTFAAGVLTLKRTVQEKEQNTAAEADAQKGGTNGEAKLAGLAAEANVKANAARSPGMATTVENGRMKQKSGSGSHKCTPADD